MGRFFDKLEDYVRGHLARYPITYALTGGIGVVLFWRGVWETADILSHLHPALGLFFYAPFQIVFSTLGLMLAGLMVSVFIGERIIISGIRHEKKVEEKTESLIMEEEITLNHLRREIQALRNDIKNLSNSKNNE